MLYLDKSTWENKILAHYNIYKFIKQGINLWRIFSVNLHFPNTFERHIPVFFLKKFQQLLLRILCRKDDQNSKLLLQINPKWNKIKLYFN